VSASSLILVPGLLCSERLFASQAAAFSGRIETSVAIHTAHDTMAAIARSILATAPPRFALAGLSMGGYIAQEIMHQAPDRVDRLCLLDTRARPDTAEETVNRHRLLDLCAREGVVEVQRTLMPRLIRTDRIGEEPLTSEILKMAEEIGEAGFRRQMAAIMSRQDLRAILHGIRCPTTIIVGEEDVLTPPEMSREMAELIPDAMLEILPCCGHMSTMEAPEEVNRILADWLDA
jgi:pimeloyl-ACP methyl ester carboxylesterase